MPRSLLERCQPDSIREFRAAARQRFQDAVSAAASDRRTAAVYLWGYAAEVTLKGAYFRLIGFGSTLVITPLDLQNAVNRGIALGVVWPTRARWHNVRAWAELLVTHRSTTPGLQPAGIRRRGASPRAAPGAALE